VRAIVDADGEIVVIVSGNDAAIAHNTPPGCMAITDPPPSPDAYRVGEAWVKRPARPSAAHTWDGASKQWSDQRPPDVVKRDLVAPLLQRLVDEDVRAIRPLAELVAALINGQAPAADAKSALAGLLARKDALRSQVLQISAAAAVAESSEP
jgi:hypothetical protein